MKYTRDNAKAHAKEHMTGIWAAALMPFDDQLRIDEDGFRENVRHWTQDLGIEGIFVSGKQGEFFSMSLEERKRSFELAVEATGDHGQTIMSCSDQNVDVVLDLARHAQECGADYIVVHAPALYFFTEQDETLLGYYRRISESVDIGIALWSHPSAGYLMSPQLCNRLADLDNVVAIKYSVDRPMYAELTELASDRIQVSTASEPEWLDNILELDWRLYLCSSPPFLLQSGKDRRMWDYTREPAGGPERISPDGTGTAEERGDGARLEGVTADPRHVTARGPAPLGVRDPHRDDGQVGVGAKGLDQPSAQVGGDHLGVVVEERQDRSGRAIGTRVASPGHTEVLGEFHEDHVIGHVDRAHRPVGHHDDLDRSPCRRPPNGRDRRVELCRPVPHGEQDPAHAGIWVRRRRHARSLRRTAPRPLDPPSKVRRLRT